MARRKIDPDSSRGDKLIRLFGMLLFTRKAWSLVDLSVELKCSKQTVMSMVDEITRNDYSIPIVEFMEKGKKYYKLERQEQVLGLNLSISEVNVLMMCQAFAKRMLGEQFFKKATLALEKSQGQLPADTLTQSHYDSISVGTIDYTGHHEHISDLIRAMNDKKVCRIQYQGVEADAAKTFYIKPLKMFSHKNALYLNARMAKYPNRKYIEPAFDPLLAIHRIQAVEVTERPFEFPDDYDFDKKFNLNFGLIKEDTFQVDAEFYGWAARYVAERIWSEDQIITPIKKGGIRISFSASSKPEVLAWMLSMGEFGKLISPQDLMDDLKQTIASMNQIYTDAT